MARGSICLHPGRSVRQPTHIHRRPLKVVLTVCSLRHELFLVYLFLVYCLLTKIYLTLTASQAILPQQQPPPPKDQDGAMSMDTSVIVPNTDANAAAPTWDNALVQPLSASYTQGMLCTILIILIAYSWLMEKVLRFHNFYMSRCCCNK